MGYNKVYIDNFDYTGKVIGLDDLRVTYSKNGSSKVVNRSITNSLTFIGSAYDYLKNKFFDSGIAGRQRIVEIRVITDCCGHEYKFNLRGDAVEICFGECEITTNGFEYSDDQKASDFINTYLILQRDSTLAGSFQPYIKYCESLGFFEVIFYGFFFFTISILSILGAILAAIGVQFLQNIIDNIKAALSGCNGEVRLIYLKDIFTDIATAAGLTPQSTILLQGVYSNATWLDVYALPNSIALPSANKQSDLTAAEILDIWATTFNAEWQIRNGKLYFERRDYFFAINQTLCDVEGEIERGNADGVCYSFSDVVYYRLGRFNYSRDSGDTRGNLALSIYNDIVLYNLGNNTSREVLEVDVPLGAAHFNKDEFTAPYNNAIFNTFALAVSSWRPFGALILTDVSRYQRQLPKIIVIQPQDTINDPNFQDAKPIVKDVGGVDKFNYPMFMEQGDPDSLYEQFFSIEDPATTPVTPYLIEEFEFVATCAQFEQVRQNGIDLNIITQLGQGVAEEIELNYASSTIILKNVKIRL